MVVLLFSPIASAAASAQIIDDDHTAREEAEGKIIWQQLQDDGVACTDLSDDDFGALGEYYMGQMLGDAHAAMNTMMTQMMGEEGEEQVHVVMGQRLSGCDPTAEVSNQGYGYMPMMNMMTGGWSSTDGFNNLTTNSMMNFGMMSGGWFGWLFMIIWWVLIIVGIVALVKWLAGQAHSTTFTAKSSPLEILQERYAKGEIDKKEFDEKKQDLL
jgi:putative membrane protein